MSKVFGTWVTKWTEEMAKQNGWQGKAEAGDEMGVEDFDEVWIVDGDDELEVGDVMEEVTIRVIDYCGDRLYEECLTVDVLRKEIGKDWGNERMFFEGEVMF